MRGLPFPALAAAMIFVALPARADDAAATAKIETCLSCHGETGISPNEGVPSIAGQPNLFVPWQLVFFRGGKIKSEIMAPIAAEISDEDIRAIGPAVAALSPAQPAPGADDHPDLTTKGTELARERHCGNCHGEGFVGQQAAARLAGQREEVLVKALHDYKSGARFGTGVAAMPEIAFQLNDDDITALAHYMSRLR
jgi:cytochrome c553